MHRVRVGFLRGLALLPFYTDSWQEATFTVLSPDFRLVTFTVLPFGPLFASARCARAEHTHPNSARPRCVMRSRHAPAPVASQCTHEPLSPPPAPCSCVVLRVEIVGRFLCWRARFYRFAAARTLLPFYAQSVASHTFTDLRQFWPTFTEP